MSEYHIPVLLKESIDALLSNPDGIYADATYGGGGHSAEILARLSDRGRLFAFDRDEEALKNKLNDPRLVLFHNNFRFIHNYSIKESCEFDGILADLGVSSHQFDTAERGFSFRYDSPLDMRMGAGSELTAGILVNTYAQEELERIFKLYGEVENSHRIASLIASARSKEEIRTTSELNAVLAPAIPSFAEHKYLARVYQALRIEVNGEMRSLEKFLYGAAASLKKNGRLVVITYHSLEDRMVKNFIKAGNIEGKLIRDIYGKTCVPLAAVNKKPILPQENEIASNTRARSAKLRIAERV